MEIKITACLVCSSGKMCTDRCVENKLPGGFIPWLMITSVGLSILHPDINTLRFLVGGGQPGQPLLSPGPAGGLGGEEDQLWPSLLREPLSEDHTVGQTHTASQ